MKLTLNQIIDLFNALTALRGEPQISFNDRGQKETIYVPYPLSDRARWVCAHNRQILKRFVVQHEEINQDRKAEIIAFKKGVLREARMEEDPKARAAKLDEATKAIEDKVDEANEANRKDGRHEEEVDGLRMIPAKGLRLKTSNLPPTIISELMPLIDGEPHFEEEKGEKAD